MYKYEMFTASTPSKEIKQFSSDIIHVPGDLLTHIALQNTYKVEQVVYEYCLLGLDSITLYVSEYYG